MDPKIVTYVSHDGTFYLARWENTSVREALMAGPGKGMTRQEASRDLIIRTGCKVTTNLLPFQVEHNEKQAYPI